jgi:hypothetical protein
MLTSSQKTTDLRNAALPFDSTRLPSEKVDHLDAVLEAWCQRHHLGGASFRHVAGTYVDYCAPREAPHAGVDFLAHFVACFFALNDLSDEVAKRTAIGVARVALATGEAVGEPEADAFAELRMLAIRTWGMERVSRLLQSIDRMLGAFDWEIGKHVSSVAVEEYLCNREHTIGNYPFIEPWRLSLGADPTPEERLELDALEAWTTRLVYTVNDLLSVERDQRKQKLNLVLLLASERGTSIEDATARAYAGFWEDLARFAGEWRRVRALMSDRRAVAYVDYLAALVEGNRAATVVLTDRFWGNG